MDIKTLPHWTGNNLVAYFFAKRVDDPVDDPRFEIKCLNRHFRKITFFANHGWDVEIKGDGVFYIRNFN